MLSTIVDATGAKNVVVWPSRSYAISHEMLAAIAICST
jgi:hypothetical protein